MDPIEDLVHPATAPSAPKGAPSGIRVLSGTGVGAAAFVASWAVILVLVLPLVVSRAIGASDANSHGLRPNVGPDVHAVVTISGAVLLGGHDRAARSPDRGRSWEVVSGLEGVDVMAWASLGDEVLAAGHGGMYRSADGGLSFARVEGPAGALDLHALGAQGATVVAASPSAGLMRSTDSGRTWRLIERSVGRSLMGPIAIDPANPVALVAVDMSRGVVLSRDGGATWRVKGGGQVMAVAVDPHDPRRMLSAGPGGGALSLDGGASWQAALLPPGTSAVSFYGTGTWLAVALIGGKAWTYASNDDGASWQATNA